MRVLTTVYVCTRRLDFICFLFMIYRCLFYELLLNSSFQAHICGCGPCGGYQNAEVQLLSLYVIFSYYFFCDVLFGSPFRLLGISPRKALYFLNISKESRKLLMLPLLLWAQRRGIHLTEQNTAK